MEGNNLQIRPLFDNVVVRKEEFEEKSKTGIITGSDDQPALVGTVLTVGRDVEDQVKPGDKIMYAPFSGRELGGFLLLAQHDIMGVVIENEYHSNSEQRRFETTRGEKMKCIKCGIEGYPYVVEKEVGEIFNGQKCPNCGNIDWKRI